LGFIHIRPHILTADKNLQSYFKKYIRIANTGERKTIFQVWPEPEKWKQKKFDRGNFFPLFQVRFDLKEELTPHTPLVSVCSGHIFHPDKQNTDRNHEQRFACVFYPQTESYHAIW